MHSGSGCVFLFCLCLLTLGVTHFNKRGTAKTFGLHSMNFSTHSTLISRRRHCLPQRNYSLNTQYYTKKKKKFPSSSIQNKFPTHSQLSLSKIRPHFSFILPPPPPPPLSFSSSLRNVKTSNPSPLRSPPPISPILRLNLPPPPRAPRQSPAAPALDIALRRIRPGSPGGLAPAALPVPLPSFLRSRGGDAARAGKSKSVPAGRERD